MTTQTTATLPTTGNRTLDETLDRLTPDAKIAALALLERVGQDGKIDLAMRRLAAHTEELQVPNTLTRICQERDDPQMEIDAEFWMAYRDAWKAAHS